MSTHNPFDISTADLGDNNSGIDRLGVDSLFSNTHSSSSPICLICSQPAQYKLIPKHKHLDTAQIQDKGYACKHCISQHYVSPTDYRLREL